MTDNHDDLISVPQAAAIIGVTRHRVGQLIAAGRLPARRIGPKFLAVSRADATTFQRWPRGRPARAKVQTVPAE